VRDFTAERDIADACGGFCRDGQFGHEGDADIGDDHLAQGFQAGSAEVGVFHRVV
jgi:hypothetical protein